MVLPVIAEPASDGSQGGIAVAVSETIIDAPTQEEADRLVRERQPHLAPQWQKVEQFRKMLAREAS